MAAQAVSPAAVVVLPFWQTLTYGNLQGNVVANATLTAQVPVGATYGAIWVECLTSGGVALTPAQIRADILNVKLIVDGENIIDSTSTRLLAIQQFDGQTNRNGILPVITSTPQMRDVGSLAALMMGTGDRKAAQIQVTLAGTVAQLASAALWVSVIAAPRPMGAHVRVIDNPQTFAGTGFVEIPTLPRYPSALVLDLHCDTATNVTQGRVRVNGSVIANNVPVSVNNATLDFAGYAPQTAFYHQSFNQFRTGANGLKMDGVNDFAVAYNFSVAPTNFTITMRYLHNFGAYNGGMA